MVDSIIHRNLLAAVCSIIFVFACANQSVNSAAVVRDKPQPSLSGVFEIITLRRASDVAGGVDDPSFNNANIGKTVSFGKTLSWFDGTNCDEWSVSPLDEPIINLNDPNLSDLNIGIDIYNPDTDKHRNILRFELTCDGIERDRITQIDDRILIVSSASGLTYAILERPLSEKQIEVLQQHLKDMKFYDGDITGQMDEATIASVSQYASYSGRYELTFKRIALTENLLSGLGVTSCCSDESPARKPNFPDYKPKLGVDTALDYRPRLASRIKDLPAVSKINFQRAYVALGDFNRSAIRNPGSFEQGNVALGADREEYVPSDEEVLAAELGDQLAVLVQAMNPQEIIKAWDGAALMPASTDYYRFEYRHVDVMGSGRFFYASKPHKTVIDIPAR